MFSSFSYYDFSFQKKKPIEPKLALLSNNRDAMRDIVLFTLVASAVATPELFAFEKRQLQAQDLQGLSPTDAALFGIGPDAAVQEVNQTSGCKVFPGDSAWPSPHAWDVLSQVTGNSLVASVPRASSCYDGPRYDPKDCEYLTSNWTNSYFQ